MQHESFSVLDATKLKTFQRCPRKAFFAYQLGWVSERPSIHLVHGEAWHRALEFLLVMGLEPANIEGAFAMYLDYYRQFYTNFDDLSNSPKNPATTLDALEGYVKFARDKGDHEHQVLFTEIAGSVPVSENQSIHFRLDTLVREHGKIRYWEHKTGSRLSEAWTTQWIQNVQTMAYLHVLYCAFDESEIEGGLVNGTFFYKSKPAEFKRVPIKKSKLMLGEWLWNVNRTIDEYKNELRLLEEECKPEDPIMKAFPKRTEACTDYGICPFFDYCMDCPNPMRYEKPVAGFKVEYWDPRNREKESKAFFDAPSKTIKVKK